MKRALIVAGAVLLTSCSGGPTDKTTDGADGGVDGGTNGGPSVVATGSESVCNCSTLDCAKAALASPLFMDCGVVGLHGDTAFEGDGGVECALKAQDAGQPFSLQVDEMGIDTSENHLFLRRDDGSSFEVSLYVSANFGGSAKITATGCSGFTPIDPVTGDAGTQSLSCDGPNDHPTLPCR